MIKYVAITAMLVVLSGCLPKYQETPQVLSDCKYDTLPGTEFIFSRLSDDMQNAGYTSIHTNTSRTSLALPYQPYVGMKGKLLDKISTRDYQQEPGSGLYERRCSVFSECEDNKNLYLTQHQQDIREQNAKFVVRQALLSNCEIVYIQIDSQSENYLSPKLILPANLTILNK